MDNHQTPNPNLSNELEQLRQELQKKDQQVIEAEQRYKDFQQHVLDLGRSLAYEREQRVGVETRLQVNTALHSTLQYDEILDLTLDQVGHLIPHDAACIILAQGNIARVFRWYGYARFGTDDFISPFILNISDISSLRSMRRTGRPYVVSEADEYDDWVQQSGQTWIKSYMGAPIFVKDQIVGFLNLDSSKPNFYSEVEAGLLRAFVGQVSNAIKNAWLYRQARMEVVQRLKTLRKERNFISAVLENSSVIDYVLDDKHKLVQINSAFEETLGYGFDAIKGKYIWDIFLPKGEQRVLQKALEKVAATKARTDYDSCWITKSGESRCISWSTTVLTNDQGQIDYFISTGFDITERNQMEEALRQSEERYALAALAANDGLWDWDLKVDEVYFSGRWKSMLGYSDEEIGSEPEEWFSRIHPEDIGKVKNAIQSHLDGSATSLRAEYRMLHANGKYRWILCQWLAIRDDKGNAYRLTGSQTDITQRKMTEERLWHASYHDALTGLPNRTLFMERMERSIERAKEDPGYKFAVLFLDLDRFKVINDSMGHLVGDQLLMIAAGRLQESVRPDDTVARFGGDEFAILIEDVIGTDDVTIIAERVHNELAKPIILGENQVFTSASIGIALHKDEYEFPEDMLRDADTTMYKAKAQGRGRHEMFRDGMHEQAVEVWELEAELRRALEEEELEIYYQPIISLQTGAIVAIEALLRWHHPERGIIPPDKFIPLAEETGLIIPIGHWVLSQASRQAQVWHQAGYTSIRVAVNVSFRQFQTGNEQHDLPSVVAAVLAETGLPPTALELEITESIPPSITEAGVATLNALKALGINIALDDFGISSALTFLKYLPIDTVKIDRSFVKDITANAEDDAIISAIITMAHNLHLNVIAEGVETQSQLDWLAEHQCDEVQGYLFSHPLGIDDLTELLKSGVTLDCIVDTAPTMAVSIDQ